MRRVLSGLVASGAAAVTFAAALSMPASADPARTDAARAAASYQALQRYLAVGDGSDLYVEQRPAASGDNPYSYEWPFSQVHQATLNLTGVPGPVGRQARADLPGVSAGQEHYWKASGSTTGLPGYDSYLPPPYGTDGDLFYDDNEWVGLEKAQEYLMTGDSAALDRAEQIFALVESGWDTDTSHADPGGVFWTQATWSTDRNTVSNMPAAELGLRLYQATHKSEYLDWALRMYDWTNRYLQSPSGLYWDHVSLTGDVETTFWSYNQGVPIGVNVLLYQVTHDAGYLKEAKRIASAAYDYYVTQGQLDGQPPYFNSIFFGNLLLLESVTGGHTYRAAMADYADDMWNTVRDPDTGLFVFDSNGATETIQQAAMVQIYALLAWPASRYRLIY